MKLPARIRWLHVRRFYETLAPYLKASPIKLHRPDSGRVLVLSPHVDDDIIGSGGCLSKHVKLRNEVMVVYFADCTEERVTEAEEAAGVIGLKQLEFFEYKSKTLLKHQEIADRLSKVIADFKPEIVYLPSLLDRHNDHLAVNHHLAEVYKKYRYDFTVCAYEVWTAFIPNLIVDISDTVDKKKDALALYKTQLSSNNWLDAAISLNRYRGVASGVGAYAEGFMRYSMKEYFTLWQKIYER